MLYVGQNDNYCYKTYISSQTTRPQGVRQIQTERQTQSAFNVNEACHSCQGETQVKRHMTIQQFALGQIKI